MKTNKTIIIGLNLGDCGSSGSIMRNYFEYASNQGDYDYYIIVPRSKNKLNLYEFARKKRNLYEKIIDNLCRRSKNKVEGLKLKSFSIRIIKKIKKIKKKYNHCIIHIHTLHHCNVDIFTLFNSLAKMDLKICYTLHDCWPFTGGCYCFNFVKCFKWKKGCIGECPQNIGNQFFKPNEIFKLKEKTYNLIKEKTTLIAVSKWVEKNVKVSFLKGFKLVLNYTECSITSLSYRDISLINQLGLSNKKIILTISPYWERWKGPDYIYKIADKLPNNYVIVVIGRGFDVKKYKNIINLDFVDNNKLNRYYSIADVYISTSQDESLGLTTCEAQICGVPVVAFGHGGIKETITNKTGYIIGENNDVDLFVSKIKYICEHHPFKKKDIIKNGNRFAKYKSAERMLRIYDQL